MSSCWELLWAMCIEIHALKSGKRIKHHIGVPLQSTQLATLPQPQPGDGSDSCSGAGAVSAERRWAGGLSLRPAKSATGGTWPSTGRCACNNPPLTSSTVQYRY
jgi:hypothetical protein